MNAVRIGIIGMGNIGVVHAKTLLDGRIARASLTAVANTEPDRLAAYRPLPTFTKPEALIQSGTVDAVIIATPHYSHVPLGIAALRQGLHVMMEKPIAVHKSDCERLFAAHTNPPQVFAAMFQQRTDPVYQQIRELLQRGELGALQRVNWTTTNWFRSEAYYASGKWRATWAGEGGGVLLNQAPHQLDLFQWFFGMPRRVRAFCQLGKFHNIEVEDNVTAYLEFDNGATAVFATSTGEAPGTQRIEIAADRGRLVYENETLTFLRNEIPASEFNRTTTELFAAPATTEIKLPVQDHGGQHVAVLQNFVDAILDGTSLLAPAAEGIHSVELANAMLYSSLQSRTIELPLDGAAFELQLQDLIRKSKYVKPEVRHPTHVDLSKSFHR
jgi:predicted dehydrogenase